MKSKDYLDYECYVGYDVRIKPGTRFAHQISQTGGETGTVLSPEPGSENSVWLFIGFPNGYQNSYPFKDLILTPVKQVNDSYTHLLKPCNEEVPSS